MTLTTEQLRARAKFWREKAVEAKWESVSIAQDMLLNADAFDELAANREAQPVGFRYRHRDTASWLYNDWRWPDSVEAEQCQIEWLYTAPPAPAIPDIGSSVVNDAAWKLHDTLTKYGPLNGNQFNHLKSCLYEALKIVMTAPPAQAAPEKN